MRRKRSLNHQEPQPPNHQHLSVNTGVHVPGSHDVTLQVEAGAMIPEELEHGEFH